jgi:hypothetical protein
MSDNKHMGALSCFTRHSMFIQSGTFPTPKSPGRMFTNNLIRFVTDEGSLGPVQVVSGKQLFCYVTGLNKRRCSCICFCC